MLALAAIGLSLIYGTTGSSNFAHAEMRDLRRPHGADVLGVNLAFPFWIAIPLAVILTGVLGLVLDTASGDHCENAGSASCS